jgi:UDP-3-O-[3-hydroxymyristoyl] N-acetylglucosamine deacetylase
VPASIRLEGYALHRGIVTAVTLSRRAGPITFERDGYGAALERLEVRRSDAGVALTDEGNFEVDLVEHLLAAFGGLGIRQGVTVIVEGAELPILDGGARAFANALRGLELPADAYLGPELVVSRAAVLTSGRSRYAFEIGEETNLSVETVFDHPALGTERAEWDGSTDAFHDVIAPARTFGFRRDARELWARGRAALAAKRDDVAATRAFARAVVVFDETGAVAVPGEPPPSPGEVIRHKLLDLIGDFALYGGPPRGRVFAELPGHTASHRIIREALSLGILSRR